MKKNKVSNAHQKSNQVIKVSLERHLPCDVSSFVFLLSDYLHGNVSCISGHPRDAVITRFTGSGVNLKDMTILRHKTKNGDVKYQLNGILEIPPYSDISIPCGYLQSEIHEHQVPVCLSLASTAKRKTMRKHKRERTKQIKPGGNWGYILTLSATSPKSCRFNSVASFSHRDHLDDILLLGHQRFVFVESRDKEEFTVYSFKDQDARCTFLDVWWMSYQKLVSDIPYNALVRQKQKEIIFSFPHQKNVVYLLARASFLGNNHEHLVLGRVDGLYGLNLQTDDLTRINMKTILCCKDLLDRNGTELLYHFVDFAVDGNTIYLLGRGPYFTYFILSIHVSLENEQYRWVILQTINLTAALKITDAPRKIVVRDGKVWLAVNTLCVSQFRIVHF